MTKRKPPIYEPIQGIVWGIYLVTCLLNGREYVGCSDDIKYRWGNHCKWPFSKVKRRYNNVRLLYDDIREHGLHNFKFEVIYRCSPDQQNKNALFEMEKFFIFQRGTYNPTGVNPNGGYNLTRGGAGSPGAKYSAETKAKMSAAHTGEKRSKETRAKISAAHTGKKHSKEHRAKKSAALKGKNNPMFNKQHSEEARDKMSAAKKGKKQSAKHIANVSAAKFKAVLGKRKHESDDAWVECESVNAAAKHFKCGTSTVSNIINGRYGSKKFDFEYVE